MHIQIWNSQNQMNGFVNKADGGPGTFIQVWGFQHIFI